MLWMLDLSGEGSACVGDGVGHEGQRGEGQDCRYDFGEVGHDGIVLYMTM